ncbi:MAG: acyl-CoA dehydrogenase family protein [Rhodocyclaceae bacterium]
MSEAVDAVPLHTHEVTNQSRALEDYDLFARNAALSEAVEREGAGWAAGWLAERGAELGSAEWMARAAAANRNPPVAKLFDRHGRRCDAVEFHPAWHECMAWLKRHGAASGPWADPRPGAHVARAALFMLFAEIEDGSLCPTTMSYGAVPVIRREPEIARDWLAPLLSREYDPRDLPVAGKRGALMGMGLTEKQGGSDVRANSTRAEPLGGGQYRITGHKWFLSAPMCDAFLVTAQAPGGLSCFLLPRWTPDGRRNAMRIQRLKDKLGDRSNASAEVEFHGAWARRVGEEGRGIRTVLEMGNYTRLDCALASAGVLRQCVSQALDHIARRAAFGRALRRQPLMMNAAADVALESEAATVLAMRVARAFDRQDDEGENVLRRLLTPMAKFWLCRRLPAAVAEAMEMLGGNGYVEESVLPRLFRQSPLNSIWEGSGNVMCLDVLRAIAKQPRALEAFDAELAPAAGKSAVFDRYVSWLKQEWIAGGAGEGQARRFVQDMALALQGALLLRFSPEPIARAFCASRLAGDWGYVFGTLPANCDFDAIIERAWPE